jgi:hypothetical protein
MPPARNAKRRGLSADIAISIPANRSPASASRGASDVNTGRSQRASEKPDVAPSDGGAHVTSTKIQLPSVQPAQPVVPAFNRYADLGPRDGLPHWSMQKCKKCGDRVKPLKFGSVCRYAAQVGASRCVKPAVRFGCVPRL